VIREVIHMERVKCLECDGITHAEENDIPQGVKADEAFLTWCAFCKERKYATLVVEEK
jgi:hypothetical protein